MKIIYILILTLLISGCESILPEYVQENNVTSVQNLYENDLTWGDYSDCSDYQVQTPTIDFENTEQIYLLTVNRYRFRTVSFIVVDDGINFTLNSVMLCAPKEIADKFTRVMALTKEQKSIFNSLYENIDVSKLTIVDTNNSVPQTIAISFGYTGWLLQVIQDKKEHAYIQSSNPEASPETLAFYRLGEYLWKLSEIESPLHYKDITKRGASMNK